MSFRPARIFLRPLLGAVAFLAAAWVGSVANAAQSRFILDMVHNNPGEPPQPTAFRDPRHLADIGYNGQVIEAVADSCQTFDKIAPGVVAKGSEERQWIERHAADVEQRAARAHAAGLKAYAWMQFIILPKSVVAKFRDEICDAQGRIDLSRPKTVALVRAQVDELFDRCPSLDGMVVRTGEVYLHDSPFHAASGRAGEGKMQSSTAILDGPQSHIQLLQVLRDEVCVKRGKMVFYRTWDFGDNFHTNPAYYLKVTDAIPPHPNLVFSIKHQKGDFLRMLPFNPTLGIGKHPQIVEVQAQREAYGKGAHPYYIADGLINGWEEDPKRSDAFYRLKEFVNSPNFAGIWTWSRGGGWMGPYIKNELWCELNAWVVAKFAEDPQRSEADIFHEFATRRLGLSEADAAKFRQLNLLSASAVLRGQCSLLTPVDLWWARDDFMGVPKQFRFIVEHDLVEPVLAEKAEAVKQWRQIEQLSREISVPDRATQEFIETSCTYGRIKYAIFQQGWTAVLLGMQGERTHHPDRERIARAIAEYDRLWAEWKELAATHPSCATLCKDWAFGNQPGLGAAVDKYRHGPAKAGKPPRWTLN